MKQNNWLKKALANEDATQTNPQNANQQGVEGQQTVNPPSQENEQTNLANETNETNESKQINNQRQTEIEFIRQIAIPETANKAIPSMNESLHYLTNELMSRDDIGLPEPTARILAIEIMAAWLFESRKNTVSEMTSILTKSQRINAIVNSL